MVILNLTGTTSLRVLHEYSDSGSLIRMIIGNTSTRPTLTNPVQPNPTLMTVALTATIEVG